MISYKVAVVGNYSAGKSSILNYLVKGEKLTTSCSTIGAAFFVLRSQKKDTIIKYEIWDCAGQSRFRSLVPMYLRNVHLLFLVYDRSNPESFRDLETTWIPFVRQNMTSGFTTIDPLIFLLENKVDLPDNYNLTEQGIALAAKEDFAYHQTSAISGQGIATLLEKMNNRIIDKVDLPKKPSKVFQPLRVLHDGRDGEQEEGKPCGQYLRCN